MEEYLLVAEGPVQIKRRVAPHTLNQIVRRAFGSYQDGDFAAAEAEYRRALRIAPRSRQILLGLAACLLQQNQTTAAKRTYQEVLRLYPDDTVAESALLNMGEGRPDLNNESYLKSRLAEQPDNAYLHFALGNVFSSQQRWTEAQQAYFDAFRYDKINPNYVYNLAVSLEHLGKSSTALSFYEQAYSLSAQYPAQFNRQRLSQRIAQLKNG
jgi:tetratricopeptide (TPR) repeat protein